GIAIDPVPVHLDAAKAAVAEAALTDDILVLDGRIEALPLEDAVADWIWCRDVLPHVDVGPAFGECARVLRPGGRMLVYATLATGLLEPREAWTLYDAVAVVAESMDRAAVEDAARAARLTLVSRTALGGEWRERMVEDGAWDAGADLLRLSRLRRREDELVDRHGATRIAAYRGGKIWGIYQLLGKLFPTVYVWRRDA
ncbi:MAG TPA: methyltransferase domain-containing protein, partial [Gaiellaceae bacterium]|nr:methyltransferase domain-containing protein [Gaiellaceae bacterium]